MVGPMTLQQLVQDVDSLEDELTVFRNPEEDLSANSEIFVVDLEDEDEPEGLKEFIDIWHIQDVIKGKAMVAGITDPDVSTKTNLLIDYAKNGA